jgi:hypothetical protein
MGGMGILSILRWSRQMPSIDLLTRSGSSGWYGRSANVANVAISLRSSQKTFWLLKRDMYMVPSSESARILNNRYPWIFFVCVGWRGMPEGDRETLKPDGGWALIFDLYPADGWDQLYKGMVYVGAGAKWSFESAFHWKVGCYLWDNVECEVDSSGWALVGERYDFICVIRGSSTLEIKISKLSLVLSPLDQLGSMVWKCWFLNGDLMETWICFGGWECMNEFTSFCWVEWRAQWGFLEWHWNGEEIRWRLIYEVRVIEWKRLLDLVPSFEGQDQNQRWAW